MVYPNPATNVINIETPQKSIITITNYQAQVVKTIASIENSESIDISQFAKGVYFVKVQSEKGIGVVKFIKE